MISIQLKDLHFFSYHGIENEEKMLGNRYVVNASIDFKEGQQVINDIESTLNYVAVYNMIKKRMAIATPLLETLVMQIGNEIYETFPFIHSLEVSIVKLNPPIEGIEGSVAVSYKKQF